MTELTKKLIGFDEDLLEKLQKYSKENNLSFTVAVRVLLEGALDQDNVEEGEPDTADIATINQIEKRLDKLEKDMSWWNADENESKVGNLKVQVDEMEKKLNMVVAIAKKLKGHMENREIHLQD